jgi:hypothetical protein
MLLILDPGEARRLARDWPARTVRQGRRSARAAPDEPMTSHAPEAAQEE